MENSDMPVMISVSTASVGGENMKSYSSESQRKPHGGPVLDKDTAVTILKYLKKKNLDSTLEAFRHEAGLIEPIGDVDLEDNDASDDVGVWSAYKTETDPLDYEATYNEFKRFLGNALDLYKHELHAMLYPVFLHMYIELVYNGHEAKSESFMKRFGPIQEYYYQQDITKLAMITRREHMKHNDFLDTLKSNQFTVRLSRDAYSVLRRFMDEKRAKVSVLLNVVQEHLYLDVYEGIPRNKEQVETTAGAMNGEAMQQANKGKVYYGLPKEPDVHVNLDEPVDSMLASEGGTSSAAAAVTTGAEDEASKPKKKKSKKDSIFSKKTKNDPNAPPVNRLPLPEPRDVDKKEKLRAVRESMKRITLGPDSMPSICFYTFTNTNVAKVTCVKICEDTSLLAVGFSDSKLKIFTLVPTKLKAMKKAEELTTIDKCADDVYARMMDESTAEQQKQLVGHCGPIYCCSFSPDRTMLLSCAEDGHIRLWSLLTWTCLVIYRGHIFPVWEVKFAPHGFYFASCGHDKTVRLWSTDQNQPQRLYAGHLSDVDCVEFHPNSNYVASGSSDRTVRLWDCVSGSCVRVLTGHKTSIHALAFSNDGRYLASGSRDGDLMLWDLARAYLLARLDAHSSTVYSLCFSRDGNLLASGGLDCTLKLWDYAKLAKEFAAESSAPGAATPGTTPHNPDVRMGEEELLLLGSYPTKKTPIIELHFTRRNLLVGAGAFDGAVVVASDISAKK
ncbi:unnamed protein product [Notodromas monacha]|uniref:Transcription initiation factor TFIID subunit 5 n=1 Tax=Notodromas monacha TaxID=399045 RepID=A0A7R9BXB1_9CRUS|nr:unnamed protein product [Notodromas monacha]CAG0921817.1 unnamed protein product [Notodromas monacha]